MSEIIQDEPVSEVLSQEEMEKELARLRQSNQDKFNALGRMNKGISPAVLVATRLEVFINTFIPDEDKVAFELNFESAIQNNLNGVLSQVRQSTLLEGVSGVDSSKLKK